MVALRHRSALLLVVTCLLWLMPAWSGGALADGPQGAPTGAESVPEAPAPPASGETEAGTEAPLQPPVGGSGGSPPEAPITAPEAPVGAPEAPESPEGDGGEPTPEGPSQPSTGGSAGPAPESPVTPSSGESGEAPIGGTEQSPGTSSAGSGQAPPATPARPAPGAHRGGSFAHAHGSPRGPSHGGRRHAARPRRDLDPPVQPPAVTTPSPEPALAPTTPVFSGLQVAPLAGPEEGPPAYLIPIYMAAGRRYDVPWSVLAAINQVETDFGRDLSISSAGAEGWMQFMPDTWSEWAVDADHDGHANPYSPIDAIFTAARYLQASGASSDLPGAIFAYNHADWYVSEVLLRARTIEDAADMAGVHKGLKSARGLVAAMTQIGTPYEWGGESAHVGFDCSGLVQWAFAKVGIELPRTAQEQYEATRRIDPEQARPGDLVFFGGSTADITHVGIVIGPGWMLDATHTGAYVEYSGFTPQVGSAFGSDLLVGYGRARQ
jgi:hypothetical protein